MEGLQIATNVSVIATAVIAMFTLILNLVKEKNNAKPYLFPRRLEYEDDFCDIIVNCGIGEMQIVKIEYFYMGQCVSVFSLVDIYEQNLTVNGLMWKTYLDNKDLIGRVLKAGEELRLVEIDPSIYETTYPNLLQDLRAIRQNIAIKIIYKNIYGVKKKCTIDFKD